LDTLKHSFEQELEGMNKVDTLKNKFKQEVGEMKVKFRIRKNALKYPPFSKFEFHYVTNLIYLTITFFYAIGDRAFINRNK
jgi:hypothetical protein